MLPSSMPTQVAFSSMSTKLDLRAELRLEHDLGDVGIDGRTCPRVDREGDRGALRGGSSGGRVGRRRGIRGCWARCRGLVRVVGRKQQRPARARRQAAPVRSSNVMFMNWSPLVRRSSVAPVSARCSVLDVPHACVIRSSTIASNTILNPPAKPWPIFGSALLRTRRRLSRPSAPPPMSAAMITVASTISTVWLMPSRIERNASGNCTLTIS